MHMDTLPEPITRQGMLRGIAHLSLKGVWRSRIALSSLYTVAGLLMPKMWGVLSESWELTA